MRQINRIKFLLAFLTCCSCGQKDLVTKSTILECYFPPQPAFPGGLDSLKNYINRNLKHPSGDTDIEGKVFVQFVIDEGGHVTEPKIIKGLCDQCDKNAIEVMERMPKWTPAKENGKGRKTRMIMPITFKL